MITPSFPESFLRRMVRIYKAAKEKKPLLSCQGQAMDGVSELANYRTTLEDYLQYDEEQYHAASTGRPMVCSHADRAVITAHNRRITIYKTGRVEIEPL